MFAYMDASDHYRADELLRKYKLKVKFKNEWCAPNNRYRMIFCTVPKRQAALFKEAMAEMPARMLLLGYEDYSEYWTEMLTSLGDSDVMATQA
jgi:hypothetical protein